VYVDDVLLLLCDYSSISLLLPRTGGACGFLILFCYFMKYVLVSVFFVMFFGDIKTVGCCCCCGCYLNLFQH
jgi:hypothetical protein